MFTSPSQIIFTVFGVNVYYYGVVLALAIAAGVLVSDYIGSKFFEFKKDTFIDLAPYVIISGIIGARLYYCMMDFHFYLKFPTEILAIRHGGISIHGAILGGLLGLWIYARRHKLNFYRICDISAIGLALGQAIGRWGNFFNSEAYGTPTNLPWKLFIAPQYRQVPYADCEFYHPTFLYESILDFVIFLVLFYLVKKYSKGKEGNFALIYLILYSFARIAVETCRIDSVRYVFGVPVAIIISVGIIILSSILLYKRNK
ncbi:prolipoprotein diacylglyceryl transferase [bacterium]|nr:prolipoprotein diacylglyceryl transferase [bacterium]